MRATLFGDLPLEQWPPEDGPRDAFPWSVFAEAREQLADGSVVDATRCWRSVIEQAGLESRHYLQAWHFLREHGERAPDEIAKQLLGVVVEMGLPEGLDLLAVYSDRSARYYNHAGGGVVLERAEGSLLELMDALLAAAAEVVVQIGPWDGERPGPPARDHARLSFLTPSGLHFGEGPTEALEDDPRAGLVLRGATAVMAELIAERGVRHQSL
jgi:hypothetical protein